VERCDSERINDGEQWHGAVGSRRRSRDDLQVQDEGVVWRHGGANSRLDKVDVLIPPKDRFAEDGGTSWGS
jgi:hypothetical protein